MTREEAITRLTAIKNYSVGGLSEEDQEVIDVALRSLEAWDEVIAGIEADIADLDKEIKATDEITRNMILTQERLALYKVRARMITHLQQIEKGEQK